jgi:hypothetical protein
MYGILQEYPTPADFRFTYANPTSPSVYQLPTGTGAHLAGLNKLFFRNLILGELLY